MDKFSELKAAALAATPGPWVFVDDGWVFFQRLKEYGGGYWLGRTYNDAFIFGLERHTSLFEGIQFILASRYVEQNADKFDDDFQLF